jgi:hypothetical protein
MTSHRLIAILAMVMVMNVTGAFVFQQPRIIAPSSSYSSTLLSMSDSDEDIRRFTKQSRSASVGDNLVELRRPLGIVLNEDDNGNVFVETLAPKGNAARSGLVKEGDIVTMCSATFGNEMWSCRGVGLTRVLAAIRVSDYTCNQNQIYDMYLYYIMYIISIFILHNLSDFFIF